MMSLDGIQATNDDATQCKRFAVEKGYWRDPFIRLFGNKPDKPRTPEINRGYFARVFGMKILLDKFIKITRGNCQIINLGAGFDTLFWRLTDEGSKFLSYVDVDLPGTTARKLFYIQSKRPLLDKLKESGSQLTYSHTDLHAPPYHLIGCDITNCAGLENSLLRECGINPSLDTVFLSECVLVYLPPSKSHELLHWISSRFTSSFFINYEQVNMCDRFGQVMIDNLKSRDCELLGVAVCASKETASQRFVHAGFDGARVTEMGDVYRYIPQNEVARIEALELLDDQEVIQQLFYHYAITYAHKDTLACRLSSIDFV